MFESSPTLPAPRREPKRTEESIPKLVPRAVTELTPVAVVKSELESRIACARSVAALLPPFYYHASWELVCSLDVAERYKEEQKEAVIVTQNEAEDHPTTNHLPLALSHVLYSQF